MNVVMNLRVPKNTSDYLSGCESAASSSMPLLNWSSMYCVQKVSPLPTPVSVLWNCEHCYFEYQQLSTKLVPNDDVLLYD